jgi:hypothetical protein
MSKHTQHLAEFAVLGSTATEFGWDAGSQDATLLQRDIILGDEQVFVVVASRACRKFWAQLLHGTDKIHDSNLSPKRRPWKPQLLVWRRRHR